MQADVMQSSTDNTDSEQEGTACYALGNVIRL